MPASNLGSEGLPMRLRETRRPDNPVRSYNTTDSTRIDVYRPETQVSANRTEYR